MRVALTAEQKALLAQITLRPIARIEVAASSLSVEQERLIADDIETWEPIKDSHVKITGEVDFDNERKRQAIRSRILVLLGLSSLPPFFALASASRGR